MSGVSRCVGDDVQQHVMQCDLGVTPPPDVSHRVQRQLVDGCVDAIAHGLVEVDDVLPRLLSSRPELSGRSATGSEPLADAVEAPPEDLTEVRHVGGRAVLHETEQVRARRGHGMSNVEISQALEFLRALNLRCIHPTRSNG